MVIAQITSRARVMTKNRNQNPFTGKAEKPGRFGPRRYQAVQWPEALHEQIRIIEHETGLTFSAIAIRALARYADWYFKRKAEPGAPGQKPVIEIPEIKIGGPDKDPF